jgi:predicted ArsR family transcriptional regulator
MAEWTFVTNHALVLSFVAKNPLITALEMAIEIGITERAVRKIIKDLETAKYLSKRRDGRRVQYIIRPNLALRHRTQRDKLVGDLLRVLGWNRKTRAGKNAVNKA